MNVILNKESGVYFCATPFFAKLAFLTASSFSYNWKGVVFYIGTIAMTFRNKIWHSEDLKNTHFEHCVTFKQYSFVNVKFDNCQFKKNAVVSFH